MSGVRTSRALRATRGKPPVGAGRAGGARVPRPTLHSEADPGRGGVRFTGHALAVEVIVSKIA